MPNETELTELLARYRAALSDYLAYHMEHRVTALHLQRLGHWGPAETCAYHGRYKALVRFEALFGEIEPGFFQQVRSAVEAELERRDAINAAGEQRRTGGAPASASAAAAGSVSLAAENG